MIECPPVFQLHSLDLWWEERSCELPVECRNRLESTRGYGLTALEGESDETKETF